MALFPHFLGHNGVHGDHDSGVDPLLDQFFGQCAHDVAQPADLDKGQRFTGGKKNFHKAPRFGRLNVLSLGDYEGIGLVAGEGVVLFDDHVLVGDDAV